MKFRTVLLIIISCIFISCDNSNSKPKDFDVFWEKAIAELDATLSFEAIRDSIVDDKKWSMYKVNTHNNLYFYAWISEPIKEGKFPIKIRFSGISKRKGDEKEILNSWFLKGKETINMLIDINAQGLGVDQTENILTYGLDNKQHYIYKEAYLCAVKAIDFISINSKSDGNIIVTGGGQGATLSIIATALNPKVSMCIIGFPFLTDMKNYDKKSWPMNIFIYYSRNHKIDYFELKNTLLYFDMLNFSDKINAPIFIRAQEKDKITPLEGTVNFFNQIKTEKKEIYIEPCEGHGCSTKSKKANELERAFIKNNLIIN